MTGFFSVLRILVFGFALSGATAQALDCTIPINRLTPECCGAAPCPVRDDPGIAIAGMTLTLQKALQASNTQVAQLLFIIRALVGVEDPNFAPEALIPATSGQDLSVTYDSYGCVYNPVLRVQGDPDICKDDADNNACYARLLQEEVRTNIVPGNPVNPDSNTKARSKDSCRSTLRSSNSVTATALGTMAKTYADVLLERLKLYNQAIQTLAKTPCLNPEGKYPTVQEELDAFLDGDFSKKPRCLQYQHQLLSYMQRDIALAQLHLVGIQLRKQQISAKSDLSAINSFQTNAN